MSLNQSRAERSESSQYKKSGRSGSSAHQRNFSGSSGKGGGTAPPPSSSSINSSSSSLTSNRSFKRTNNAQGGQSRVSGANVNSDSNKAPAGRTLPNGSHLQPQVHADTPVTGITVKPTTETAAQGSGRHVAKASASQSAAVSSDASAPATPGKAQGDTPRSFPLQFGSISPGFMNGMQIPARTNSAPPNLDEQKRAQARHDSSKAAPAVPIPSVPKQQLPRRDVIAGDQSNAGEAHQISKTRRDVHISSAPPVTQTQKAPIPSMPGVSVPMPFHQPQVPVQFGGSNPQIQSQGMSVTSLPMPMPMQVAMGNASQLQQQVFVQPHPMQPQGIMHQGQSLNFTPQIGSQLPQLGNSGIGVSPQFAQQTGKFGSPRKPVKITHPETHEELRLDGGTSGLRSHPNVPQSQPITSVPPAYSVNYYGGSYNPSSLYYPVPSPVPLTGNPINPSSQAPRFSYPVNQGPQTLSFMNPSAHNSYPNKNSSLVHGAAEPSSLELSRDIHSAISLAPSASVQVTVKPPSRSHVEKIAESSPTINLPSVEKSESPRFLQQPGGRSSMNLQKDSEASTESSLHHPSTLPVAGKQSNAAPPFAESNSLSSVLHAPIVESASVVTHSSEGKRRETISLSDSIMDQQKQQIKKGHAQTQLQVSGQPTSISGLPSPPAEHTISFDSGSTEIEGMKSTTASSSIGEGITETTGQMLSTHSATTSHASESKTDNDGQDSKCKQDEIPRLEALGKNEQGGTMLNEGPKQDRPSPETYSESSSLKSLDVFNHTKPDSVPKVTTDCNEVGPLQIAKMDLGGSVDECRNDGMEADNLVISAPAVLDTNAQTSSSSLSLSSRSSSDNKTLISDASMSGADSLGSTEGVTTKSFQSVEGVCPVPSASERISKHEGEGDADSINAGLESLPAAVSKDKPVLELGRTKSTGARGKKKRKEILQKADAAGTTSDLYMAYKGPEGNKETVVPQEIMARTSSIDSKQAVDSAQEDVVSKEKGGHSKAELDDWEDAADISTPKVETADEGKQVPGRLNGEDGNGVMVKKYSRDFLLKFSEQCCDLPDGFKKAHDVAEALMASNVSASRESISTPGRNNDRLSGAPRLDRRGSGLGDDDKWNKSPGPLATGRDPRFDMYGSNSRPGQGGNYGVLRNPRAQPPAYAGGILSGPMQLGSQGGMGMQRNHPDSDRWQRTTSYQKGLIPSPQTPTQVMHKAEKKYEVGKVADEEQAKQRQLKAILNKLTPQNFEKLFEQVKAVNIDNAVTLTGVISQIFDKALMEPTFCEMYANFCYHLAGEMPDFSEDNEIITFKRLLLNKCQEEFERGEREQEEADRADQEGELKQSAEEREEKRVQARRRMLGNIRLIGELYKKRMLTERIMHECIKKLLGQFQNPDEENIEALCKLMSTIGEMIDHPKAKEHMDAYFDMMSKLSNNMKLSSRVRFMLKDAIDLRKNKWQQRRKVEGPKKIEEVHRDAAQERHGQAGRLARGPGINSSAKNRQSMDFGPRGSSMLSSPNAQLGSFRGLPQVRGFGGQDFRFEDRHPFENRTLSVPLPQRSIGEDSITLGPQGGLARGMSIRGQPSMTNVPIADAPGPGDSRRMASGLNGYSSVPDRTVYGRESLMQRNFSDRVVSPYEQSTIQDRNMNQGHRDQMNVERNVERSLPTSPTIRGQGAASTQNVPSDKVWPEQRLRDMSIAAIKEFYSAKDENEVALCVKELNAPSFYPTMISLWVSDSFERKDMERELLAKLLISLSKTQGGMLNQAHLVEGFESVLATLEDAINDAPKAGEFLGRILAKVVGENVVPFRDIGRLIYEGGEEQGRLVEIGLAAEVVGTILETIKSEKGETLVNEILRQSSGLKLENFRPPDTKRPLRLDKFII